MRPVAVPLLLALLLATPAAADPPKRPALVDTVERARARAREKDKPLLIISVNGNLDGFC